MVLRPQPVRQVVPLQTEGLIAFHTSRGGFARLVADILRRYVARTGQGGSGIHGCYTGLRYSDLPKIPSYRFNERLKELGQRAKLKQKIEVVRKKGNLRVKDVRQKWEMMSSHTCRRSFCTNMYLAGFPAEELMRISGHKSPAAFMRYIKVDNMQAANRLKALREKLAK